MTTKHCNCITPNTVSGLLLSLLPTSCSFSLFLSLSFALGSHTPDWFPGWEQFQYYNRQPNDDGLSDQDCVEIRRQYRYPPTSTTASIMAKGSPVFTKSLSEQFGSASSGRLLNSFMWNDRDCNAKNYFICERPMDRPEGTVDAPEGVDNLVMDRGAGKESTSSVDLGPDWSNLIYSWRL